VPWPTVAWHMVVPQDHVHNRNDNDSLRRASGAAAQASIGFDPAAAVAALSIFNGQPRVVLRISATGSGPEEGTAQGCGDHPLEAIVKLDLTDLAELNCRATTDAISNANEKKDARSASSARNRERRRLPLGLRRATRKAYQLPPARDGEPLHPPSAPPGATNRHRNDIMT
jgi:hypothetical protein